MGMGYFSVSPAEREICMTYLWRWIKFPNTYLCPKLIVEIISTKAAKNICKNCMKHLLTTASTATLYCIFRNCKNYLGMDGWLSIRPGGVKHLWQLGQTIHGTLELASRALVILVKAVVLHDQHNREPWLLGAQECLEDSPSSDVFWTSGFMDEGDFNSFLLP